MLLFSGTWPVAASGDNPYRAISPATGNSKILAAYGQGFASDELIRARVGELKISMDNCDVRLDTDRRVVRVKLSRRDIEYPTVVDGVLLKAAEFAWNACSRGQRFNLKEVDIYFPDGSLAYSASLGDFVYGDTILGPAEEYHWHILRDGPAEARQRAQEAAFQAERVAMAQRAAEASARSAAEWNNFFSNIWTGIKILFFGAIAVWLFSMRETFMRWYYLFTPHPATSMVETAMHTGAELDGKAFAEIMRPMPGGRIEKEVRADQARKLAERAHRYAESMRAEADRIKAKAHEDAEFIKAQDELLKAATVHEQAKARLDALRKRTE